MNDLSPSEPIGEPSSVPTPIKRPRLFHWSVAHNSYMPVDIDVEPLLSALEIDPTKDNHGCSIVLRLFSMSDEDMANLPEL